MTGVLELGQTELGLGLVEAARTEAFSRSDDGLIHRSVRLRNGTSIRTVIGTDESGDRDLQRAADLSYLRLSSKPDTELGGLEVTVADLFSGCGGMSLGFAEACRAVGQVMKPVLACDTNQFARKVYADNFDIPEPPSIDLGQLSSLTEAPRTSFEVGLTKKCHEVRIVLAGPPCQGHSGLNNHTRGDDPKNGLYFKVARFVRLFAPELVVIENVPAVVKDSSDVVSRTCEVLSRDYDLSPYLVDLSRLGVPQNRKRHLLVGVRHGSGRTLPTLSQIYDRYGVPKRPSLWAIRDIIDRASTEGELLDRVPKIADVTRERIEYLFRTDQYDLPNKHRPKCHQEDHTYPSVYGRMRGDEPAPTITRGFSTMGQGRFVHPERERTLTPREAARLQFIPDFFSFRRVGSRKFLHELIGNAVPPKLSYVFGVELLR